MAQYEHLPIFKDSYDFMIDLYKYISNFPKEYKYSLWEKLKNYSLDIVIWIYEINSEMNKWIKKGIFFQVIKLLEKCKILVRISKDIKILSLDVFIKLSNKNINILKQLEWWKRSII